MKKLRLCNVYTYFGEDERSDYFMVDKYSIFISKNYSMHPNNQKYHTINAHVEFKGKQANSLIFNGEIINNRRTLRKRKLIDDILVIGSILTGWNWILYSRKKDSNFLSEPKNFLDTLHIVTKKEQLEECFNKAMTAIRNNSWQIQYENGFHLRMLLNHSNINNIESRFLSNIVIWEWLYPHLKNRKGATIQDESFKLNEIINYILKHFWPNANVNHKNIFYVLRNQLAHSGQLPINRSYAEKWMTSLTWGNSHGVLGVKAYITFFDKLTQVIVLKTLNIDAEFMIDYLHYQLNKFLNDGKL